MILSSFSSSICFESFCAQTNKKEMNSTNSTTPSIWIVNDLEMSMVCINLLLVLPTHSYVIWLIIRGNGVGSEIFNLNLSVCEIGACLDSLLLVISSRFSVFLTLSQFLQGLGVTGRPLFQSLMCVERYLAVVHPVTFLKYKPLRYRVICCTVVWIFILGSCLCCMLILSTIRVHVWFLMQFLIFLSIELFCCLAVLRALKQSGPGERRKEKEAENHMNRRAFYLILISTVNMMIVYAPYSIIALFNILTQQNIPILWFIALICYVLSSFFQSVLYLHRAGKLSCLFSS